MTFRFVAPVLAGLALVAALPAGGAGGAAPTIAIAVCRDVALVSGGNGRYYTCRGPYPSRIPHRVEHFALLVHNRGLPKGSKFQLRFLDQKTGRRLAAPLTLGPVEFDPGLWKVTFPGPFPAGLRMKVQPVYRGKTIRRPVIVAFR